MKKITTLAAAAIVAAGTGAQQVITLDLTNPANPETIEYNDNGSWVDTYNDEIAYLEFSPFMFSHILGGGWGGMYWDGFTICRSGDTTDWYASTGDWVSNQWYSIAGGGVKTENGKIVATDGIAEADPDAPYLVGYYGSDYAGAAYEATNVMFNDGKAYWALGVYVTNHTWPYYGCQHGDGFAREFDQEGDYLKLIATGYDINGMETGSTEFVLDNYTDGELHQVDQWTWWNLSELGEVDQIVFTMDSSDKSQWGINTAKYFCLDKLQVTDQAITAVNDVRSESPVTGVTYVNAAGQIGTQPFEGMNIVVTRHADGTTTSTKVIK